MRGRLGPARLDRHSVTAPRPIRRSAISPRPRPASVASRLAVAIARASPRRRSARTPAAVLMRTSVSRCGLDSRAARWRLRVWITPRRWNRQALGVIVVSRGDREEGELFTTAPKPVVLGAIALLGCAVPLRSVLVATTGDDVELIAVWLLDWVTVPYILAGAVAWLRRPESRLGPLMLAGGFAAGLSALQLTHVDGLYTLGAIFDILPAALFLHVCLAFPDGRLRSRFEEIPVGSAYGAALGLQLLKMSFGVFGPRNLLELSAQPDVARIVQHVQLVSLSAICLVGVGLLVTRRRQAGRPRRRSLALLIDLFALGLVM